MEIEPVEYIDQTELTQRVKNKLRQHDIHRLVDLTNTTEQQLIEMEGFGPLMRREVKDYLDNFNLSLKP